MVKAAAKKKAGKVEAPAAPAAPKASARKRLPDHNMNDEHMVEMEADLKTMAKHKVFEGIMSALPLQISVVAKKRKTDEQTGGGYKAVRADGCVFVIKHVACFAAVNGCFCNSGHC